MFHGPSRTIILSLQSILWRVNPYDTENVGRDLVVGLRNLQRIDELHTCFMPLHFALILHHTEDGLAWALSKGNSGLHLKGLGGDR